MSSLAVRGGVVHVDGQRHQADVVVDAARIASVGTTRSGGAANVVDASGCSVLPGFVDLQVNGAVGVDLTTQPQRIGEVAAFLVQCGVTSFMPTVISSSPTVRNAAIAAMGGSTNAARSGARSLGIHLEGPFLNPERAGAHPVQHLRLPMPEEVQGWSRDGGVAMVTIAPELAHAVATIEQLVANGVSVCAGHSAATPADMQAGIDAGLRGVTHLFNAMAPLSARLPGPAGATLAGSQLIAGLIVDGLHVDPVMVRLAWQVLGSGRVALVTDAISALGLPHGSYSIGDTSVIVDDTGARTTGGVLAGSVLRFDDAVRNLMAFTGCALQEASLAASSTPATLAQRSDIGRLVPDCLADIVVLDEDCQVVVTVVDGQVVFDPQQRSTS